MGQNPGTPVNTQRAFKKDYSGVVTNPKKVPATSERVEIQSTDSLPLTLQSEHVFEVKVYRRTAAREWSWEVGLANTPRIGRKNENKNQGLQKAAFWGLFNHLFWAQEFLGRPIFQEPITRQFSVWAQQTNCKEEEEAVESKWPAQLRKWQH